MAKRLKPDPDQLLLSQDPDALARDEDKRLIRQVKHSHVVAYCKANGLDPPSERQWQNVQEVLTFLRHCEWAQKGEPTAAQIARGCSKHGAREMSERTVQRSLSLAESLGVLFSAGQGRTASVRTILYARLREMLAATVQSSRAESAAPTRQLTRQTDSSEHYIWRVENTVLAGRTTENGGSIPYTDHLPNQPTTTTTKRNGGATTDVWPAVVEEVRKRGVNQAPAAVDAAKTAGATPVDVRALLEHFDKHRDGWGEYAAVILYRRLGSFSQAHGPTDGWPALSEEYKRRVAKQASLNESVALGPLTLERRRQNQQARQRSQADFAESPATFLELVAVASPELADGLTTALRRQAAAAKAKRPAHPIEADRVRNFFRLLSERDAAARETLPRPP